MNLHLCIAYYHWKTTYMAILVLSPMSMANSCFGFEVDPSVSAIDREAVDHSWSDWSSYLRHDGPSYWGSIVCGFSWKVEEERDGLGWLVEVLLRPASWEYEVARESDRFGLECRTKAVSTRSVLRAINE